MALVAIELDDLDFHRNLPQGVDGVFELWQVASKRSSWDAARELCPALDTLTAPGSSQAAAASHKNEHLENLVICVEDAEAETDAEYAADMAHPPSDAVPSLREAAPSLDTSALQIVEIDPEEEAEPEPVSAEPAAAEPAAAEPPEPVEFSAFGAQARAAFRRPRSMMPQGQVEEAFQVSDFKDMEGSLLGPSARLQFKRPRLLATPVRAISGVAEGPPQQDHGPFGAVLPSVPGISAFHSAAGVWSSTWTKSDE